MQIEILQREDLDAVRELQPPDWDDITTPHRWYLDSAYCTSMKLTDGRKIIGIGTAIFHQDTAWLAHIIVHPVYRNQGHGKVITRALVDHIDQKKFGTIYLIATDLGYPVYSSVGFTMENEYVHFTNNHPPYHSEISPDIIPFEDKYTEGVLLLDRSIYGEDRRRKLQEHFTDAFMCVHDGKVTGAYFTHLANGLIIAEDPEAGIELMKLRLQKKEYAIFPVENKSAIDFMIGNNFSQVRVSRRMFLGKKRSWQPHNVYNRVSGQVG